MSDGSYYGESMVYSDYLGGTSSVDWSGCHRPAPMPEQSVEFDSVNRAVILVEVHPEDCHYGRDDCPAATANP